MLFSVNCEMHGGYDGDTHNRPQTNDFGICLYCGSIRIFVSPVRLQLLSDDDLQRIFFGDTTHALYRLGEVRAAIINRRKEILS